MPTPRRLAVVASLLLAAPAVAEQTPVATAPTAASRPSLPADGRWSMSAIVGFGPLGPGAGFGGALGGPVSEKVRLDVFADVLFDGGSQAGYDVVIARGTVGLALAYRAGRLEPWFGLGLGAASASATYEEDLACVEHLGCASVELAGGEARANGAVLAAGLRVAVAPRFLVALEFRKPLMDAARLDGPPGTVAELGAPFFGFGLMVRTAPPGR